MTRSDFTNSLIGFGNLATASGLGDLEQAFAHMLVALGIADRNQPLGCTREGFLKMAGVVYDNNRKALTNGPQS